jgi:septal ring factor EnvC (AmiA/AmiB activator)
MTGQSQRLVDTAKPRASFDVIRFPHLTTEKADKARTDLFRQIRRTRRTVIALAAIIHQGSDSLSNDRRSAVTATIDNLSKQLREVSEHLQQAEHRLNEGIAKILDPRPTVKELERAERKRRAEEDCLIAKRQRIPLSEYKKNKYQEVAAKVAAQHKRNQSKELVNQTLDNPVRL